MVGFNCATLKFDKGKILGTFSGSEPTELRLFYMVEVRGKHLISW